MLHEQEALYQAQSEVFPNWGRTFYVIAEITNYLENLLHTEWFFDQFGVCPAIQIKEWKDRNRWAACASRATFTLFFKQGPQAESNVLHELAHLLCEDGGHGQCFADTQLKLVRQQMGFQAYAEYHHALRSTGVFV